MMYGGWYGVQVYLYLKKTYLYKISRILIAHEEFQVLSDFTQNIKVPYYCLSVGEPTGNRTILVLISVTHAFIMDRKNIISYLRQVHRFLHNGVLCPLWLSNVPHAYRQFNP